MRTSIALAVTLAVMLAAALSVTQAEDPEITYRFSGQALIGGEPAPDGTIISATVEQRLVGTTAVAGGDGRWSMEIGAWHLRTGVCEAVFHVAGEPVGKQTVNCQVDVLLETGGDGSDDLLEEDDVDVSGDDESEIEEDEETSTITVEVTAEEMVESDELEEADEADELDEEAEPAVQPRVPHTGTGGLDKPSTWPTSTTALVAPAVALVGLLILTLSFGSMRRRRR